MSRTEVFATIRSLIQGVLEIRDLELDDDSYYTFEVWTEDGEIGECSMPSWYPEGIAIEWTGYEAPEEC